MDAWDGNAIAGQLFESFGREMTVESGTCRHCGNTARVAELRVYLRAPGSVARCPTCGKVVLVLVDAGGRTRSYAQSFEIRGDAGW
jgi:hypothetical protein